MERDSSRKQDYILEIAAKFKVMAAAMGQAVHTVAQNAVQYSLMSRKPTMPQEQLSDSCAVHDRRKFAPGALVGTNIALAGELLRTLRRNEETAVMRE
jgi:hypothetical protein